MWIKRDDLTSPECGGNKVRALEFLLGGLNSGTRVLTVGGAGSTHVLSTTIHGRRIGLIPVGLRWKHDMNAEADFVARRLAEVPGEPVSGSALLTLVRATYRSWRTGEKYIPIGGSTSRGILGHVNAALELAAQVNAGEIPATERIILPLGTGGTTAGLLLGLAIAGLSAQVVGVRVGPRIFVNARSVMSHVRATRRLIFAVTGERVPEVDRRRLRVAHDFYGGGYGRPLKRARNAERILNEASGLRLDGTYSAKAWAAALEESAATRGPVLFWLTFDARCLTS